MIHLCSVVHWLWLWLFLLFNYLVLQALQLLKHTKSNWICFQVNMSGTFIEYTLICTYVHHVISNYCGIVKWIEIFRWSRYSNATPNNNSQNYDWMRTKSSVTLKWNFKFCFRFPKGYWFCQWCLQVQIMPFEANTLPTSANSILSVHPKNAKRSRTFRCTRFGIILLHPFQQSPSNENCHPWIWWWQKLIT